MSKTSRKLLINSIKNGIITYLREGKINSTILSKKIINPDLDKIQDFDTILRIHFILQDKLIEFISQLNKEIRRLKKRTINNYAISKNFVKGRILWQKTLLERSKRNYRDKSLFICNDPKIDFNIPENIVLKILLTQIYSILIDDLRDYKKSDYNYKWFSKWNEKKDLIQSFFKFYQNNIYLNRIKAIKSRDLSSKDLLKVFQSRHFIYRKAAELLYELKKIENHEFDQDFISDLLNSTLIVPEDNSTLFELFCLFKIIFNLQKKYDMRLNIIGKKRKEFAVFENNKYIVKIFHDSNGSLKFNDKLEELDFTSIEKDSYFERIVNSIRMYGKIYNDLFGIKINKSLYRGRPDIIIEKWEKKSRGNLTLVELYIGEIKYTNKKLTISRGLKELIEYIHFANIIRNIYLTVLNIRKLFLKI